MFVHSDTLCESPSKTKGKALQKLRTISLHMLEVRLTLVLIPTSFVFIFFMYTDIKMW
ncbi:hypothetical protein MA16_Dca011910 [Dendrobium catenatum]|uniref:Uncharacterized protein n=1 Tax=Dendrobium catenatum TaxID=906689 RepID=A0A2I0W2K9_9ASPA|nr:hypothetical protein MA16_Dca011910 [Dendrobium catenatum]